MTIVFLAHGFEEIEALATVDVLRRAGIETVMAGIGAKAIEGAHGITITSDVEAGELTPDESTEAVVLPGGMPGTANLEQSSDVSRFIDYAAGHDIPICAICAAPSILGRRGLLDGVRAVCYPGYEEYLPCFFDENVVRDRGFITARSAAYSIDFALEIVYALRGGDEAQKLRKALCM